MRITGGVLRGRRFETAKGVDVRPTAERVREAVFGSLEAAGVLRGTRVLDLYAGTGALGLEALSRGASEAVFVEVSRSACAALRETIEAFDLGGRGTVICGRVEETLSGKLGEPFDLVFADPPYGEHPGCRMISALLSNRLCREGSILVVESAGRMAIELAATAHGLAARTDRERDYGDTRVTYMGVIAEATHDEK